MDKKLFRAPNEPIRVVSLNGQAAIITKEPRELPESLWSEAYSKGALSGDMESTSADQKMIKERAALEALELEQHNELVALLKDIKEEPSSYLDKNNKPITRKISAKLGRAVTRHDILNIWDKLVEAD